MGKVALVLALALALSACSAMKKIDGNTINYPYGVSYEIDSSFQQSTSESDPLKSNDLRIQTVAPLTQQYTNFVKKIDASDKTNERINVNIVTMPTGVRNSDIGWYGDSFTKTRDKNCGIFLQYGHSGGFISISYCLDLKAIPQGADMNSYTKERFEKLVRKVNPSR